MSENFSFNKYSKRVKFAYTRWQKRFSSTNDITEQAIFCCEFIIYVSDCCNKSDINDFCEIINTVWQQIYGQFNDKQNKDWETAKKFVECQYLNEAETKQHLAEIENKLMVEKENFINDSKIALGLFDFTLDDKLELIENNEKYLSLISDLQKLGYKAFLADNIEILNAKIYGVGKESKKYLSEDYDIVTNGTFFGPKNIYGTLMTNNGVIRESESPLTKVRGCLIIYKSGLVLIDYTNSNDAKKISSSFKISGNENGPYIEELMIDDNVSAFIAGGVLLIKDSKLISGDEIYSKQQFQQTVDGSMNGMKIGQLRKAKHVIWGIWNSVPFLIVTKKQKDGSEIQTELNKLDFSDVVKFDGGSEFFYDSKENGSNLDGKNSPSGFAVKVVKF